MPIVQITVSPKVAASIQTAGSGLLEQIRADLLHHLKPAPETIQVMVHAGLLPAIGCETLCVVHHRASEKRSAQVRAACAQALHDTLQAATGCSVRVRLVALEPQDIAAYDTPEGTFE